MTTYAEVVRGPWAGAVGRVVRTSGGVVRVRLADGRVAVVSAEDAHIFTAEGEVKRCARCGQTYGLALCVCGDYVCGGCAAYHRHEKAADSNELSAASVGVQAATHNEL